MAFLSIVEVKLLCNYRVFEVYKGLISTDSISSTDPSWDHGNEKVIEKMAQWFKDVGFSVEVVEVEPGKHNMVAKMGSGEGGLLRLQDTATPCHSMKDVGTSILTH